VLAAEVQVENWYGLRAQRRWKQGLEFVLVASVEERMEGGRDEGRKQKVLMGTCGKLSRLSLPLWPLFLLASCLRRCNRTKSEVKVWHVCRLEWRHTLEVRALLPCIRPFRWRPPSPLQHSLPMWVLGLCSHLLVTFDLMWFAIFHGSCVFGLLATLKVVRVRMFIATGILLPGRCGGGHFNVCDSVQSLGSEVVAGSAARLCLSL
jgi:hypothetical protein